MSKLKELTLQPDGRLGPWPPQWAATGRRLERPSVATIERVIGHIVSQGGEVRDRFGRATMPLARAIAASPTSVRNAVRHAERLGLVSVESRPKRTYAVRLIVPVEQLPFAVPEPGAGAETETEASATAERAAEIVQRVERRERAEAAMTGESIQAFMSDLATEEVAADAIERVALALLTEVVRRATCKPTDPTVDGPSYVYAERNHYRDQCQRQRERIRTLERTLDDANARLRAVRADLAHEREMRERLEANLHEMASAIERHRRRIGDFIDDDTRRSLDVLMRTIPGFDRFLQNGSR